MVRGDRSVDVFVRKLRQKLEKASPKWRYIHTHFGIGYRFAAESLEVVKSEDVPSQLPAEWSAEGADGAGAGRRRPRAIRASSRGRSSSDQLATRALQAHHRQTALLEVDARARELRHDGREVGLVAHQQQAPVGRRAPRASSSASAASKPAGQRLVGARAVARPGARSPRAPARRSGGRAPWGCRGSPRSSLPARAARRRPPAPALRPAPSAGARSPRGFRAAPPPRDEVARAGGPSAVTVARARPSASLPGALARLSE